MTIFLELKEKLKEIYAEVTALIFFRQPNFFWRWQFFRALIIH